MRRSSPALQPHQPSRRCFQSTSGARCHHRTLVLTNGCSTASDHGWRCRPLQPRVQAAALMSGGGGSCWVMVELQRSASSGGSGFVSFLR